jgi:hypothetical protein
MEKISEKQKEGKYCLYKKIINRVFPVGSKARAILAKAKRMIKK